ncbi:putative ferric-chelate reductase 1 [Gigantopelta aegis]|uniref:putative ferric-chelate reductase 1 n=1 Tax=Gigantopelta aegis TaxID=1735272 RepID=UPI001B88CDB0|nr:putative ferric-chelate reductase 1 [Gigantopelta aegis]
MQKHIRLPTVSEKMVNFKSFDTVEPEFMEKFFIKIHACVMTFAWLFCASIGIVVSRFYKPLWPQKRFCGRKAWYSIHRSLMVLLGFLVTGAFILIFVEAQGMSDISFVDFRNMHPVIGIIVMGLTTVQILLGLFRPNSSSKNRPVFNWAHWCVGIISHILAVGNIILGVNLKKARVHEYVSYVLYCFAVYQVFIVLVLEVVACNSRIKERKQQTYSIYATRNTTYSSTKDGDDNSEEPPGSFARRVILRIHVFVVTLFTGSVVAIIAVS